MEDQKDHVTCKFNIVNKSSHLGLILVPQQFNQQKK